jgi:hypothetical protein
MVTVPVSAIPQGDDICLLLAHQYKANIKL